MEHGHYLQQRFAEVWALAEAEQAVAHSTRRGVYLEFKSDPGFELELKSLEDLRKNIRLLNVRQAQVLVGQDDAGNPQYETVAYATVYVPNGEQQYFVKKLEKYLTQNTPSGKPKNGQLIEGIADIRKALLVASFWSDQAQPLPGEEPEWIEVWLSSHTARVIASFERLLEHLKIPARKGTLTFPERSVKAIFANNEQLAQLTASFDHIAEFRRAKSTAAFWLELGNRDQAGWVEELLSRSAFDEGTNAVVCILDTGVNNGHPLLETVLIDEDCHAVDQEWGTHDHHKHGTLMAGTAAYGNLLEALQTGDQLKLNHRLESVKILPPTGQNEKHLWGYITSQAISRAAIQAPDRNRCVCMAITAEDSRDQGRPSSWSAELDQLAVGAEDESCKLLLVSAGNVTVDAGEAAANYPEVQITDAVHDPAQSWNALSVGAYTDLDQISDPTLGNYTPVAPKGGLSPFSTTSATWEENKWPIKPELLLEGGNLAVDGSGFATECDDLCLLSTYKDPQEAHFSHFNMTSAATAQLAWMSGKLMAHYPAFWPETIRGLLVHSASWPETLKRQFLENEKKTSYKNLLKIAGYGVPDLERAMFSAENSLTLISQATLQPFDRKPKPKSGFATRDMHFYNLPWPTEVLLHLPDDTPVQMRVTLSYFIEPGPGEVGWKDRYRYASHGLRFDLNSPGESRDEFIKRINQAALEEDEDKPGTKSPSGHWLLGSQARNRGSLHSDIWQGSAQELANSNLLAVSPSIGWWRERSHLGSWGKQARYSLIVSITTPDEEVDLYTPVAIELGVSPVVEIST